MQQCVSHLEKVLELEVLTTVCQIYTRNCQFNHIFKLNTIQLSILSNKSFSCLFSKEVCYSVYAPCQKTTLFYYGYQSPKHSLERSQTSVLTNQQSTQKPTFPPIFYQCHSYLCFQDKSQSFTKLFFWKSCTDPFKNLMTDLMNPVKFDFSAHTLRQWVTQWTR